MTHGRSSLALVTMAALLPACATSRPYDGSLEPGATPLPPTANAWILTAEQLEVNPSWTVLQAMIGYLPAIQTSAGATPGSCPEVTIRGHDTVTGTSDPIVYVDGTRTSDTCALSALRASEVRLLEVYPSGVTPRPGYVTSAHGLILVFLKRADVG